MNAKDAYASLMQNQQTLKACEGPHDFVSQRTGEAWASRLHYQCEKCNGRVGELEFNWYSLGLEHAKKKQA